MSAQFTYRQLGANNDPLWGQGQGNYLSDLKAVAQAVLTRLLLFQGEWWANTADGTPYWQSILGQSGGARNIEQIAALLTARIKGTPYVINLTNVTTTFNAARQFTYYAVVVTQFGSFTLTNAPQPPSGALP